MVTPVGVVKILDFGLAKPLATDTDGRIRFITETVRTAPRAVLGTPHHMAPEQLATDDVNHRADQLAFGVLLHEMISGAPPFEASSLPAVISAILTRPAPPLRGQGRNVPAALDRLVTRCLEKDPDDRFPATGSLAEALSRVVARRRSVSARAARWLRRPPVAASAAALVLSLVAGALLWAAGAERRWAEDEAVDEIASLIETGELYEAYRTALAAREHRPADPELSRLMERITFPVRVDTAPSGARVLLGGYASRDADWMEMGVTPLTLRIPYELVRWRVEKEGYEPFEGAPRIDVSMFVGGGSPPEELHPAMQPAHFAPRMETPTLMINGRDDFLVPYEASQRPFFELIGTDPEHKRHARLPGGHIPSDPRDIMREVLDWLDRYFGPVGAS